MWVWAEEDAPPGPHEQAAAGGGSMKRAYSVYGA